MQSRWKALALAVIAGVSVSGTVQAQQIVPGRREIRGLDFSRDGVWRTRVRAVQAARRAALLRGDFASLNAAITTRGARRDMPFESALAASGAPLAVTGVLRVPVLLVRYADTDPAQSIAPVLYDSALFTAVPLTGRPYNVRTYYEEISNGLLSMQGQVVGWITLPGSETFYSGGSGVWGIYGGNMLSLIQEAVARADSSLDWAQFDNNGPDGVPNSPDDDGRVDLLVLVHATAGAECGPSSNVHIWSHRWYYAGWLGQPPTTPTTLGTADPSARGGNVRIHDYIIQGGRGGSTGCDPATIMGPGTTAHEAGHGLNLPDFYDTDPNDSDDSEGIGNWGLMASGNYTTSTSPAYMEAFSREQLGWITLRPITTSGTYTLGPVETGDTAFMLRPGPGRSNPRGEYFLIENRQPVLSDSALIRVKGGQGGLAIWHVDSAKYFDPTAQNFNLVNSGAIHGLWMMQADGLDQLRVNFTVGNRGDAGDLFPGSANVTRFGANGAASARLNTAGNPFAGFIVDSIRQVVPNGEMAMRISFGGLTTVRAADTAALVRVRGQAVNVFRDALPAGDTLTVAIDSFQTGNGGRSEFRFASWTDGGAREHLVTASSSDTVLSATLFVKHRVNVVVTGTGTVGSNPSVDLAAGAFIDRGTSITLTATPGAGQAFGGWSGDTTAAGTSITLGMQRPYTLTATFNAQLAVSDTALRPVVMGAVYADTLRVSGGTGTYAFSIVGGALPPGLTISTTGAISGVASRDGTYNFTVRVGSGGQPALLLPMRIVVATPALQLADVVSQVLSGGTLLTTDEIRYLDLAGNNNSQLDIGDLVAWIDRTGVTVNAETLSRLMQRKQP